MIENLRKHKAVMMIALILVFAGLVWFGQRMASRGGNATFLQMDGRTYTVDDFSILGQRSLQLANDMRMTLMVGQLAGSPWQPDAQKFFINRVLLRKAREQFGVHPSDDEVLAYLRERSVFVTDGQFNQQAYSTYVSREIGRNGMSEKNVHDLVRDYLAYEKLFELIGAGLIGDQEFNRRAYADQNQKIDLQLVEFALSDYEDRTEVTEEEIKSFWEENQEAYTTELRRRYSFISVSPDLPDSPATPEPDAADPAPAETDAADPATAESDDPAAAEADEAADEARTTAERKLAASVDTFLSEVEDSEGAEFDSLAKEYGWDIKTTEWFTKASLPSDLNRPLRERVDQGRSLAYYLFEGLTVTTDPISKFTPAIPIADGGWIIGRLDEEKPVRPKEFAEARAEARADLIEQRALESMKTDAKAAADTLAGEVGKGSTFAEAATKAGLKPLSFTAFGRGDRPDGMADPRTIFESAARTDPGSLADVLHEASRAVIVFVDKREVVREENMPTRIEALAAQEANRNRYIAFDAWLFAAREDAKLQQPR